MRRKAAARRLDRWLRLRTWVPWPAWSGMVLLVGSLFAAAGFGFVVTGIAGLLLGPALLLVLLLVATASVAVSELLRRLRRRARETPREEPSSEVVGPRPAYVALVAAIVFAISLSASLLGGQGVLGPIVQLLAIAVVLSAAAGSVIVTSQVRARFAARRSDSR